MFSFNLKACGQVFYSKIEVSVNDVLRKGWGDGD